MHPENIRSIFRDPNWKDKISQEQAIKHLESAWATLLYQHDKEQKENIRRQRADRLISHYLVRFSDPSIFSRELLISAALKGSWSSFYMKELDAAFRIVVTNNRPDLLSWRDFEDWLNVVDYKGGETNG